MQWISVTGLDGSGKTTLVRNLASYYEKKGFKVKTAHLPFDCHLQREILPELTHSYADRLLFALDNHIFAEQLEKWENKNEYDLIISQRGFFDSFVHGAVQGYSYDFIAELNRIESLPEVDIMVHLVAEANVAYQRIRDDPDADKFEFPRYIRKQETETRNGYYSLINHDPDLSAFAKAENILIDTTRLTTVETFEQAKNFIDPLLSTAADA